ncbi:MAG: helix-turn-helix domain-containing protein [Clostridiales bacterium]|nr:helix-turn-helix domain-containing protein [Clostridiales bacterium]
MFSENLKALRKQKGMSQETLAQQLHVVRQTVSKWEKGLSVPDADMLIRIGELFEVSVSDLLGEKLEHEPEMNQVAAQLALLNEQLANRTRRHRRIFRGVLIGLAAVVVFTLALSFAGMAAMNPTAPESLTTVDIVCTLDGEEYVYSITYDQNYQVTMASGDAWLYDHIGMDAYSDANRQIALIEDYFDLRGGTVTVTEQETASPAETE